MGGRKLVSAPGEGAKGSNLRVFDSAGGVGVLSLNPDSVIAVHQVARLVDHQHCSRRQARPT